MDDVIDTVYFLLPLSLSGALLNWLIFYFTRKLSAYQHSFGYLLANQLFADALHSSTFLLYFCPMVLFDQETMEQYSQHCGFVLLFCYELSVFTHLALSLNRFYAVWVPHKYDVLFSVSRTKGIIVGLWLTVGVMDVILYEHYCWIYYDGKSKFLAFTASEFCGQVAWYGDLVKNSMAITLVMMLDMLTILRVRRSSRKVSSTISEAAQQKAAERESRFLIQTVAQGSIFMLELLAYFLVPKYFQNQWIVFIATSFAWVAVHAGDGLVVLICSPEVRKAMCLCKTSKSEHSSSNSVQAPIS